MVLPPPPDDEPVEVTEFALRQKWHTGDKKVWCLRTYGVTLHGRPFKGTITFDTLDEAFTEIRRICEL